VLAALVAAGKPVTHQQLAALGSLKVLDRVTIYRTLTTLRASSLLHVVRAVDGTAMFCANRSGPGCPGGHLHFQCLECGEMRCVHGQRLPRVSLGAGFVVKAKQLVAFGLCSRCAKTTARKDARRRSSRTERS
jgi:Fe2+ or Zn2+ uptake regulation protein